MNYQERRELIQEANKIANGAFLSLIHLKSDSVQQFGESNHLAIDFYVNACKSELSTAEELLFLALMGQNTVFDVYLNGRPWKPFWAQLMSRNDSLKDIEKVKKEFDLYAISILAMIDKEQENDHKMMQIMKMEGSKSSLIDQTTVL